MKSQNATATLGNITSCAGENVLVPLDVTNFNDIGAMTFFISYDTNAAEFLSIQNINPSIPAGISYYTVNGQLRIAYSSTIPFSISGDKLFDLSFTFLGDTTILPFDPGTEIANTNLEIIPLDTYSGSVSNSMQIVDQPDSVQSYPDNDVIFRVTALGDPDYQWQENTGYGWADLQNNDIYTGVTNDTLTIHDVTLSFNGNNYRCVLTVNNCTVISDAALLEVALAFPVATLGVASSCPGYEVMEPLFVGDFYDVVEFTFNISYDTAYLAFQDLENIYPDLLPGNLTTSPLTDPSGIVIHWESNNPVSVSSGKLFDLKFEYVSQDHILAFEPGTVVFNSFANPIDITLNNGEVSQHPIPLITTQPQNDTVTEPAGASFLVEASGTDEYLWQVSTDGGNSWTSLTETIPYYNIHTAMLTISPATYNMNGYQYACRLDNQYCTVYSSAATLIVDTLTGISTHVETDFIRVYPVPLRDKICISLSGNYSCSQVDIFDICGTLLISCYTDQMKGSGVSELDLSALPVGIYILKLTGTHNGRLATEQKKIVKIK
jgi:hypothetical protein